MSYRYPASFIDPGLNTLVPPTPTTLYNLYSWGRNNNGQLGLGNTTLYSSPVQLGSLTDWSQVSSGIYHTLAIKTNGTLWSWGYNGVGSLGLGDTTNRSSPVQVGALTNWLSVSAGYQISAAIKTNGTLWTWGANGFGQGGLGNTTYYSSPMQVGALTNWAKVYAGYNSTFAIKTDGTLWSWGRGTNYQLGLGNTTYYSSPKQVGSGTTWKSVSSMQGAFGLAVKTDGTMWSWGYNTNGQLGLNSSTYYFATPQQIGGLTTWLNVTALYYGGMAIKTNGTLWSWGYGAYGTLGLNNTTQYSSPKQIGTLTTWKTIALEAYRTVSVLKTDGTLWTWGANNYGQLGLNDTTYRSSPVQLGTSTSWSKSSIRNSGFALG